jgi:protein involved in polysaccharide export with SLBB domain
VPTRELSTAKFLIIKKPGWLKQWVVGDFQRGYNPAMRVAALFLTVALANGPALRAQNQTLVVPGDVLIVKLLSKWQSTTKIVAVTPDGNIKLPPLRGMGASEDVSAGGLGLDDAAQKLQQSYRVKMGTVQTRPVNSLQMSWMGASVRVTIERGTLDQLLFQ